MSRSPSEATHRVPSKEWGRTAETAGPVASTELDGDAMQETIPARLRALPRDLFCSCDRCGNTSRVETGRQIPRHWGRHLSLRYGWRDLCPGCRRGVAINEAVPPRVMHP